MIASKQSLYDTNILIRKQKKQNRVTKIRSAPERAPQLLSFGMCQRTPLEITMTLLNRVKRVPTDGLGPTRQLVSEIRDVRRETQNEDRIEAFAQVFFEHGGQHAMVDIFKHSHLVNYKVLHEATWILTNLSGLPERWVTALVSAGIVPALVPFVTHESVAIRQQVLWCLGNIASTGADARDHVFTNTGIVAGMVTNVQYPVDEEVVKTCLWTIANCLRVQPQPCAETSAQFVCHVLTLFKLALLQNANEEVLRDVLECLRQLSEQQIEVLEFMFYHDECFLPLALVQFAQNLGSQFPSLLVSVAHTLGSLSSGPDDMAVVLVQAGFLTPSCMNAFLNCRLVR